MDESISYDFIDELIDSIFPQIKGKYLPVRAERRHGKGIGPRAADRVKDDAVLCNW